jgi:hypothetical protein
VIARARWAITRALLVLGVLHVVDGLLMWQLWRHRRTVLRLLRDAVRDELSGPAGGEGTAGPSRFSAAGPHFMPQRVD